jgi:RNA polymerase sigma-70 factor (ECF subfamily)
MQEWPAPASLSHFFQELRLSNHDGRPRIRQIRPEAEENGWLILREADERDLVPRARNGDVEAFNVLVSHWEKRIYNYLLRLAPDADEAFDLSQETFLKAFQNLKRLDAPERFGPWLYRIAHNEAISFLRRRRPESDPPEQSTGQTGAFGMAGVEISLVVEKALSVLTPEQRESVVLKVCEGFKFEEIASILDTPASTIKSRVYTALEAMRVVLAPVAPDGHGAPRAEE